MNTYLRIRPTHVRHCVEYFIAIAICLATLGCPEPEPPDDDEEVPVGVAPGLTIEIAEIRFPEDRRPEVDFTLFDDRGNPIPLSELTDARFILGYLEEPPLGSTARYVSYTTESEGGFTEVVYDTARLDGVTANDDGTFQYKFNLVLPEDYPDDLTHQLAGQFSRLFLVDGIEYTYNLAQSFRPDGGTPSPTRDIVKTESCNQCHARLEEHGGRRREIQLCIMCHNEQSFDAETGNPVDLPVLIHKIHRGADLPSVIAGDPYQIVGRSVSDFSTVVFPQDVRNCTTCHQGGAQSDFYKTRPTLAGCTACHDRTWFGNPDATPEGFEDHLGGMHVNDSLCFFCHTPTDPGVSPIDRAHLIPTKSEDAVGLLFDITQVGAVSAKQDTVQVAIDFTVTDGAGTPVEDLAVLDAVGATIAYPASEYQQFVRESILSSGAPTAGLVNNGGGAYTYTFAEGFSITGDTYSVAMDGRREFEFRDETHDQGTGNNAQTFFTLDDSEPVPRRVIVDEARCIVCHEEIRAHGEQRTGVSYCVMCHNPNESDIARRPPEELPPTSIHFKTMIHGIHMGDDLTGDLTIFGFGNTPHDFTEVRYPAPQQQCAMCHDPETLDLPLPTAALSTLVTDGETVVSETLPERASCVSCHDTELANEHAAVNTNIMDFETCAVCHGSGSAFAIDVIHRLAP